MVLASNCSESNFTHRGTHECEHSSCSVSPRGPCASHHVKWAYPKEYLDHFRMDQSENMLREPWQEPNMSLLAFSSMAIQHYRWSLQMICLLSRIYLTIQPDATEDMDLPGSPLGVPLWLHGNIIIMMLHIWYVHLHSPRKRHLM